MKKHPFNALISAIGLSLAMSLAVAAPASADGLPGMRGHDHTGITVPDMKQAVTFFVDVLGCQKAMSFGPISDDKGTFMKDVLDVNPRAVITQITMVRCGFGSSIELFSYQSPDQQVMQRRVGDEPDPQVRDPSRRPGVPPALVDRLQPDSAVRGR